MEALINNGATPERKDIPVVASSGDTCPMHPAGGRHYWHWKDLLKVRQCSTCGEERVWKKRFEGQ